MNVILIAEALAQNLERTNTSGSDRGLQTKCTRLIVDINACANSLSIMLATLRNPRLREHVTCTTMIRCLLDDTGKILHRLTVRLEQSRNKDTRIRGFFRWGIGHEWKHHPITLFYRSSEIHIRQAQILYAIAVADLIQSTALHTISGGYRISSHETQREARDEQLCKVEQEWQAQCNLRSRTANTNDRLVTPSGWLVGYRRDDRNALPLQQAASLWFQEVVIDNTDAARQIHDLRREMHNTMAEIQRDLRNTRAEVARLETALEESQRRYNDLRRQHVQDTEQWQRERSALEQQISTLTRQRDRALRPPNSYDTRGRRSGSRRPPGAAHGPTPPDTPPHSTSRGNSRDSQDYRSRGDSSDSHRRRRSSSGQGRTRHSSLSGQRISDILPDATSGTRLGILTLR